MQSSIALALSSAFLANALHAQDADVRIAPAVPPTVVTQSAVSGDLTLILSDIATSPTSDVPGIPGAKFAAFDRPQLSPDGAHWALTADTDLPTTEDDTLIVDGALVLREGDAPAFLDPGDMLGIFDQSLGLDNAGQVAFSVDTTSATTQDKYVVLADGMGGFSIVARESLQITGAPAGYLAGSTLGSVRLSSAGVGYEADFVAGTPGGSSDNNLMMLGATIVAQNGTTIPSGQMAAPAEFWENFDIDDYFVSADGLHTLMLGDLTGATATDDVLVRDGAVVVQEGFPLPGGPPDIVDLTGIGGAYMAHNGDWMARGDFDVTDDAWAIYNGAIVAQETFPIHAGASETFDALFFMNVCNAVGDYVIGGSSSNPDTTRDGVLVLNGERVIAREGDPIDVDGNGVFDDDIFFNLFGTDDAFLTDDLKLYFISTVRNSSSTTSIGDVFVMIDLNDGVGSPFCVAHANSTGGPSLLTGTGSVVASDNDLTLSVCALPVGSMGYFVTSEETILVPNPGGSQGDLCIGSFSIGRYSNMVQIADASGAVSQVIDLTSVPLPVGTTAVTAGTTRYWQYWHRDLDGMGMPTSNFSNALCVTFQ